MYYALFCFAVILPAALFFSGIDPNIVSIVLAISAAGFVRSGVRASALHPRILGLVLLCLGVFLFAETVWYPFRSHIFINSYFLSCCCFVMIAFYSAFQLDRVELCNPDVADGRQLFSRYLFLPFFLLAVIVWFISGLREIWMHVVAWERLNGTLLFISATSILSGILTEKIKWNRLEYILLLQLPALWLLLFLELSPGGSAVQLMSGWGAAAWCVAFFVQYRILAVFDRKEGCANTLLPHLFSLWLLLFFAYREIVFVLSTLQGISSFGLVMANLLLPWLFLLLLFAMMKKNWWPVRQHPRTYLWGGLALSLILMINVL